MPREAMILAGITVLLLALIGWLATCRCAFSGLSKNAVDTINSTSTRSARRVSRLLAKKKKVLSALAAAEMFVSLVFAMSIMAFVKYASNPISEYTAFLDFSPAPFFPTLCLILGAVFLVVVVSELPFRIMSDKRKVRFAQKSGLFIPVVCFFMKPFSMISLAGHKKNADSSEEISNAIDASAKNGDEKEMLQNILAFGDLEAKEIMTPRLDIVAVEKNQSFAQLKKLIEESNYSRIPVYEDTPDNIFGIVYVKDMIEFISEDDDFDWSRLIKSITFVTENKKISEILKYFQQNKKHMAAVTDEFGGISGLITMQDILEEIVGEINDEFDDDDDASYKKLDRNTYLFDGKTFIADVCKTLGIDDDYFDDIKGDAESLAGVMLELRKEFPEVGEEIVYKDVKLIATAVSLRRIEKIKADISALKTEKKHEEK